MKKVSYMWKKEREITKKLKNFGAIKYEDQKIKIPKNQKLKIPKIKKGVNVNKYKIKYLRSEEFQELHYGI